MAHAAADLYTDMMNEMSRLISSTPVYLSLLKTTIQLVGAEEPTFKILETGDEGLASILDSMDKMVIRVGKSEKAIEYPVMTILENFTAKVSLACGFTTNEWMNLITYVVITEWRSYHGTLFADKTLVFADDKPNAEQQSIIDYLNIHPFLLVLIMMEGLSVEIVTG